MKFLPLVLILLLSCGVYRSNAQTTNKNKGDEEQEAVKSPEDSSAVQPPDWDAIKKRLVYGGNIGLSFFPYGNVMFTVFNITPKIGYKVKKNLIAGVGMEFMSISSKYETFIQYGPDVFLRAHIARILFAQTQFEYLNFEDYLLPGKRVWNPAFLVGAGYGTYGGSIGLYTNLINNRFNEQIYPANIILGGRAFFIRGELLF